MKALVIHISPPRWILCWVASRFSTRACYGRISGLRLVDREPPSLPGPGWVRFKTLLGGICGTDLGLIARRQHPATMLQCFGSFPAALGHENVALIDEISSDVTAWKVGQRVCVEPAFNCFGRGHHPPCAHCAAGRTSLCEHPGDDKLPPRALLGMNGLSGGSWSEYFIAHESQIHAVPDAIPDEQAVLVDPIASAAHAVLRRPPRSGESILVHGAGIVAMGIVASIRALGCDNEITVMARHEFQSSLMTRLGASGILRVPRSAGTVERYELVARHIGGRRMAARFGNQAFLGGFDLVYDCTGAGKGMTDAFKWTRSRGTVVLVGTSGITLLDTTPLWFDELSVIGANGRQIESIDSEEKHSYDVVFDWIASGRIDLSVIPVTRFRLAEYTRAFRQLLHRNLHPIVKAAFDHRPSHPGNRP